MAVNYVDRFLGLTRDIRKEKLQLIGLTALVVATKMEEVYVPKIRAFALTAENFYSIPTIVETEKTMIRVLGWATAPPTLVVWANWYSCQWDLYIETSQYAVTHFLVNCSGKQLYFRKANNDSYNRFRTLLQL